MSPKIIDKEEKRIKIIKAAIGIFAQKGFGSTRMDDIAAKADIGKGTIYEYFKNKDELFFAIYEAMCKEFNEAILSSMKRQKTATKALKEFTVTVLKAFDDWREFSFVVLDFWSEHRKGKSVHLRFNEIYNESRKSISEVIKAGIKSGEFRESDPFVIASVMIAVLDGLLIQRIFEPEFFNMKNIERELIKMLFEGIKKI